MITEPRDQGGNRPRGWLILFLAGLLLTASGLAVALSQGAPNRQTSSESPQPEPDPGFVVETPERVRAAGNARSAPRRHPAAGMPVTLHVPTLGVHAPVFGISAVDRTLVPPDDPQTLGWWSAGARPGARFGSALITGHTVSSGGAAFQDLDTLRAGDPVSVRTRNGLIRYQVRAVTLYRKPELARNASRLFDQSVPGRLVLVTCDEWNGVEHLSNAVVTADPIQGLREGRGAS